MKKYKYFIITGCLIVVAVIILFIWPTSQKKKTGLDFGNFIKLSDYSMVSFKKVSENTFYYLDKDHLTFYKINLENQEIEKLLDNYVYYIDKVDWSPDGSMAILKVKNNSEGTSYSFWIDDFKNKTSYQLNDQVIDAVWSTGGKDTFLIFKQDNQYKIDLYKTDIRKEKTIINLQKERCDSLIVTNQDLSKALCLSFQSDITAYLKTIDLATGQIKQIDGEYSDGKANFEKDKAIVIKNDENSSFLAVIDIDGNLISKVACAQSTFNLDDITWSESGDFLFASFKDAKTQESNFYKIDAKTGELTKLKYNQGNIQLNVANLFADNKTLYFISNDILYQLAIN